MTKTHRHVHERNYFGEFDSGPLVDWLNHRRRPKGDPVEKLVRLNAELSTSPLRGFPASSVTEEIHDHVAKVVSRCKIGVSPVVQTVTRQKWDITWRLVGRMDARQGLAFVKALQLAERGALHRVRQCGSKKCSRWFYARFAHQRFHALTCQQQTFRHDPDWMERRRTYMKDLRHSKKLRESRWLRKGSKP